MSTASFTVEPIGHVRCLARTVADVPSEGLPSRVDIRAGYERCLRGIEVGDDIFVLTVFHEADGSVLAGSPGTALENGAFSIRSSARPNRLGMTLATVTAMEGRSLSFDWLDFSDGTPVVDLKRYNWRWEIIPGTRHLDRRAIEEQIARPALEEVLIRAAGKFHGERCDSAVAAGVLAAALSHDHGVFLGDPQVSLCVTGDRHLAEAMQVLCGATVGNGRLVAEHGTAGPTGVPTVTLRGAADVVATMGGAGWSITSSLGA